MPLPSHFFSAFLESLAPHKTSEVGVFALTQASASRLPRVWCLSTHLPLILQFNTFTPHSTHLN